MNTLVLDVSERGKLMLTGGDAKPFLHGQVTNDIEGLAAGHGCYAAFLTQKGKMLGDLRVLATEDALLLDTERVALQELFNMIRRFSIGYDVELHKRTLQAGLLSVIGPDAAGLTGAEAAGLSAAEHDHVPVTVDGVAARAIRTELGVDLLCEAEDTAALTAALLAAGARSSSEDELERLRIEHGRPRYGVDLDESVIPQEAGLNARAVSFTKGCYVGQETVARLFYKGKPNRELRGLRADGPLPIGGELTFEDKVVGRITSATVSPRFGPIALALVRREAPPESVVAVSDGQAAALTATVVTLPFSDPDDAS